MPAHAKHCWRAKENMHIRGAISWFEYMRTTHDCILYRFRVTGGKLGKYCAILCWKRSQTPRCGGYSVSLGQEARVLFHLSSASCIWRFAEKGFRSTYDYLLKLQFAFESVRLSNSCSAPRVDTFTNHVRYDGPGDCYSPIGPICAWIPNIAETVFSPPHCLQNAFVQENAQYSTFLFHLRFNQDLRRNSFEVRSPTSSLGRQGEYHFSRPIIYASSSWAKR